MKRLSTAMTHRIASEADINVQRRGLSAEMIMTINHKLLVQAQQKARTARQNGDGAKWMEANEEMKKAAGMPWYRDNVAGGSHV